MEEDQAGPDPRQSHVALAGPNPEPMHDDFVTTIYPQVHEILKHTTEEHVQMDNPLSLTGTLSSMKNLDNFNFDDQFIAEKSQKMNQVMVMWISKLSPWFFTLELRDLPHKINQTVNEVVKEAVHVAFQAPLRYRFRELPEADMKEILHQRMFDSGSYRTHPEHVALYEALEASMERANRTNSDLSKKKRHDSDASGSTQPLAPQSLAWKTSDTREAPSSSSKQKSVPHSEQPVEDVPIPDDVNISDLEDTDMAHLLKIKTRLDWLKRVPEEDKPATPEPNWTGDMSSFINWFCKRIGKKKLSKADLEGPTFKVVQPFHDNSISLQFQMEECHLLLTDQVDLVNPEGHRVVPDVSKPLPLGGPPGQLKAAQYLDFGLEELIPSLWIESERDYDISATYSISHWWFKRKEFYITRHSAPSDRSTVRSHMRILSVVSLKTYERYGYTFLKEIVLRRADYNEYKISEADFKNLHPNDFEDLYLLHLQGHLNHLSGANKVHLFNAVNLWIRNIIIRKQDYTIVSKPRAVIYRDSNDQKKMMRETEMHKFSDGTLNRILDKLDHMVKDFKLFKYNPGMETRIWSEDDRRRSKEFTEVIERRLNIRRIFKSLESFVGGRLRDVDYRLIQRTE
ncbi:hypothetical protein Tco_1065802 [Tanacetum coccineum]